MNLSLCLAPLGAVAQSSERSAKNKARKPAKKTKKTSYLHVISIFYAVT